MEKFKFKKNLGQNFLQDEKVLQKIVSSIECSKDDCIIEIGPGHGALTKYLVKFNCPVIAFEIDKEVKPVLDKINADNLRIGSKEYGSITVYLDYYYSINKLFEVPRKAFYPVPNVDSAILKLTRKEDKVFLDEDKFFKFVKSAFQFKRKNLRNNLKSYDLEKINSVLVKYNHNLQNRAEEISLEEFIDIFKNIEEN